MKKLAVFGIVVFVLMMGLAPAAVVNANGGVDNDVLTVTKTLDCVDEVTNVGGIPGIGIVELGEEWDFGMLITVTNTSDSQTIKDVVVTDRLGAEFMLSPDYDFPMIPPTTTGPASVVAVAKGNSNKLFITWTVGELDPLETAVLKFVVRTDINPGGHQEFTSPGRYCLNSGATAKGQLEWTHPKHGTRYRQVSAESDQICFIVPGPPTPITIGD